MDLHDGGTGRGDRTSGGGVAAPASRPRAGGRAGLLCLRGVHRVQQDDAPELPVEIYPLGCTALAAGLFFSTLLGTFFQNGSNAYVTDIVASGDRTVAFSTLRVGLNVGWMLGPAVGSFLADTPFWRLFAITAFMCWVTVSVPFLFCPAVPHQGHGDGHRQAEDQRQYYSRDNACHEELPYGDFGECGS